jgi:hypothetical protein
MVVAAVPGRAIAEKTQPTYKVYVGCGLDPGEAYRNRVTLSIGQVK